MLCGRAIPRRCRCQRHSARRRTALRWVVAAAYHADAESIGFDEGAAGTSPDTATEALDLPRFFARRGIAYREGWQREEALALYRAYRGPIYNAR